MKDDGVGCKYSSLVNFPRSAQIRLLSCHRLQEKAERLYFPLGKVKKGWARGGHAVLSRSKTWHGNNLLEVEGAGVQPLGS